MARVRKRAPRKTTARGGRLLSGVLNNAKVFRTGKGGGGRGGGRGGSSSGTGAPSGPRPRKTDDELRRDAQRIHEAFRKGKTPGHAKKNYDRKTVVTAQDKDGNLYYSVSSNGTSPEARAAAERLGYTRINGSDLTKIDPKQTHAEHIMSNAIEKGYVTPPIRMSPSRRPCDSYNNKNNQGCGERAANNDDTDLVGW
jgi:hypothetical protein